MFAVHSGENNAYYLVAGHGSCEEWRDPGAATAIAC